MNTQKISSAALKWAGEAKEATFAADCASRRMEATLLANSGRLWAENAELNARQSMSFTGRQAAELTIAAAEAAAYAAANAAQALVADQDRSVQEAAYNNAFANSLEKAAKDVFSWLEEMVEPAAKDDWCHVFSTLDDVEDEIRRELVEHSRLANQTRNALEWKGAKAEELWNAAAQQLLEASEVEEEWTAAVKEWEEVKREADAAAIIAAAGEMTNAVCSLPKEQVEEWAGPAWHLYLDIKDGVPAVVAASMTVAIAGCFGAAMAACDEALSSQAKVAGHAARRRILRWLAAEARARRQ